MLNKTHTTTFTCTATHGKSFTTKKFYTWFPDGAHDKAIKWLAHRDLVALKAAA